MEKEKNRYSVVIDDSKMTIKEQIQFYIDSSFTPIGIRVRTNQDRYQFFNNSVVIDASKITFEELLGIDYHKRTFFEPIWYKELLDKKILVIDNLDMIPPKDEELTDDLDYFDYGDKHPGQVSFMFLCRDSKESNESRALNFGSPYLIPTDVVVFIIMNEKPKYAIIESIFRRCYGIINTLEMEP